MNGNIENSLDPKCPRQPHFETHENLTCGALGATYFVAIDTPQCRNQPTLIGQVPTRKTKE